MRVALDHQIFARQEYGGISRYFTELAKGLSDTPDLSLRVVCPLYINSYLADASHNLDVRGIYFPPRRFTGRVRNLINESVAPVLLRGFRPDLLHETYYSTERVAPRGVKSVLTVYDMIYELFPRNTRTSEQQLARKRAAIERADHVICISENTRKDLVRIYGLDSAMTSVVYLGASMQAQPSAAAAPQRQYILYVGDRGSHKNFVTLLRAYASSDQLQRDYDLVAFGGEEFKPPELALVEELGLGPQRVRHMSGGDPALAAAYQNASLFVYPSRYEGFGLPPLEAMRLGCPVVCSDSASLPEVVGDAALLFDPESPSDLSAVIERVLGDDALRRDLVKRGHKRAELFTWEKCARTTLDVYKRVLS